MLGRNGAGKSTTHAGARLRERAEGGRGPRSVASTCCNDPLAVEADDRLLPRRRRPGAQSDPRGNTSQLAARLRRLDDGWEPRAQDMLERFDLGDVRPSGDLQASATAWAAGGWSFSRPSMNPPLLLLDEPSPLFDPLGVDATLEVIADVRAREKRQMRRKGGNALVLRGGSSVAELHAAPSS